MTEEEFIQCKAEGDDRAGRCPYCRARGWIVGDPDWCPHVAGWWDWFCGSEPASPLADGVEFDEIRAVLKALSALPKRRRDRLLAGLAKLAAAFFSKALERDPAMFWEPFVRGRRLQVEVDEFMFSTTYETVFVPDRERARLRLRERVDASLQALRRAGLLAGLLPPA